MSARIGVVTFPGSLDDRDAARAVRLAGADAVSLWHADSDLHGVDAVVLPGGFSYGDYLRAGAIARFAPIMDKLVDAANGGMPVLGICNGFQVLTEVHLLPGSMIKNDHRAFVCERLRPHLHRTGGHERAGNQQQWCSRRAELAVHLVVEVQPVYRQTTMRRRCSHIG